MLESITRLKNSFEEKTQEALNFAQENKFSEALEKSEDLKKNSMFIKTNIDELIKSELNYNQEVKSKLSKEASSMGTVILCIIVLIGIFNVCFAVIFSNKVGGTINKLARFAQSIAEGNLKVDAIQLNSRDDVSILARSFNKMGENLRMLIGSINKSSSLVKNSAGQLKESTEQTALVSEQIANAIQHLAQGASEQSNKTEDTLNVVKQLYERNRKISENIDEVMATSGKATHCAIAGNEKINGIIEQITVVETKIAATQDAVENLKERSSAIGKILDSITQIASQTNLLSLNAAIEAARAGEAGKGFAVVADEVRKLADESAKSVSDITSILREIHSQSQLVADSMAAGVNEVNQGIELAVQARGTFEEIVSTSREVDYKVREITGEIQKIVGEIRKVENMSADISIIAHESSAGSEQIATAVEEQTATLEEILSSTLILSDMSEDLYQLVKKFNVN